MSPETPFTRNWTLRFLNQQRLSSFGYISFQAVSPNSNFLDICVNFEFLSETLFDRNRIKPRGFRSCNISSATKEWSNTQIEFFHWSHACSKAIVRSLFGNREHILGGSQNILSSSRSDRLATIGMSRRVKWNEMMSKPMDGEGK